ncbi:hypothetical protein OF83DRAFT_18511 [Amylostereum chailletii]|nr:hypothetical protein OF83DRAFT_18511 [Amylostereum chailletii]
MASSSPLHPEDEDLLQAALSDAFSVGSLPQQPIAPSPVAPSTQTSASDSEPTPSSDVSAPDAGAEPIPPEAHEAWKSEYETQLEEWRKQNAEQRARAEAERARWEKMRASGELPDEPPLEEKDEGKVRADGDWEKLSTMHSSNAGDAPSPADARDLVAGEAQGGRSATYLASILPGSSVVQPSTPPSNPHTDVDAPSSPRWEDIPSDLTSSFPSLSYPEPSRSHSPHHHHSSAPHEHKQSLQSATAAAFDGTLSTRTRVWAVLGALGINLLLPFVNGVMLGFGEIFAKEVVVGWFGWGSRGVGGAANVGIRTGTRKEQARK